MWELLLKTAIASGSLQSGWHDLHGLKSGWKYLHHGNWKILPISASIHLYPSVCLSINFQQAALPAAEHKLLPASPRLCWLLEIRGSPGSTLTYPPADSALLDGLALGPLDVPVDVK